MVGVAPGEIDHTGPVDRVAKFWVLGLRPVQHHQLVGVAPQTAEMGDAVVGRFCRAGHRRRGQHQHSGRLLPGHPHYLPVHVLATYAELFSANETNITCHPSSPRLNDVSEENSSRNSGHCTSPADPLISYAESRESPRLDVIG